MKILMTTDPIGGVWTYSVDLARQLAQYGVRVCLASIGRAVSDDQRADLAGITGLEFHQSPLKLEWMNQPWDDVDRSGAWLLELARSFGCDVAHLNGYSHAAMDWPCPRLVVGHSCVLSWWRAVKGEPAPESWATYRERVRAGLRAADAVVAPTHAMLASLRIEYGPLPPSQVIWNGRDGSLLGPGRKEPLVFAAGRLWDEAKNLSRLVRQAGQIHWLVRIAGEAAPPGSGPAGGENGCCLGRLSAAQVASWLGRASIYALPARYEPFGLSALEAALSSCALVLGDIPSLREVWGEAATYVHPDDAEGLAREINRLADNPALLAERAEAARERALVFTVERMANHYLALYRRLALPDRPGRRFPYVPLQSKWSSSCESSCSTTPS